MPSISINLEEEDNQTAHLDKSLGTPSLIKLAFDSKTEKIWREDRDNKDNCIYDLMKLSASGMYLINKNLLLKMLKTYSVINHLILI